MGYHHSYEYESLRHRRFLNDADERCLMMIGNEEEAEFWDTHDFSDFWYEAKPVEVHVAEHLSEYSLSKKVEVRFDEETDQELATQAKERGVKKSALIRAVMKEWLRQSHEHQAS